MPNLHPSKRSDKTLPLLKISDDQKYLVTGDVDPFFWLGDTAWELIHRLTKEEMDLYFTDRAEKGFTVIQTVILAELDGLNTPNAYGEKPLIDNDPTRLNEAYFEYVDYAVKRAEDYGLYVALLPTWGDKINLMWGRGPLVFTPENAETYCSLLGERYRDTDNIVWVLGGDRLPENETQRAVFNAMAKGLRKTDDRHLVSYHPLGENLASDHFNEEWLDFDMFQSGHNIDGKDYDYVRRSRKNMPLKPVINGEARYENIPDKFWLKDDLVWMGDADVRITAYWSMFAGAAGYTYGCNDIWQMYTIERTPIIHARTDWQDALHLPGSTHMKYMKELFTIFPWQKLENDQSLILNDNNEEEDYMMCVVGPEKDFLLVYTPFGKPIKPDISKMNAENVKAYWFNPRSGKIKEIGSFAVTEKPEFTPWSKGKGSDFVLILLDKKSNYFSNDGTLQ
ncbi:MAG: glycoside hydrolase family 140 protein [Spirochaetales bacterium]|nr:glycoside hydrolase family 140 protein [Spirochaetales bacterium]